MKKAEYYSEIRPDAVLSDLVECFWSYENITGNAHRFTILPDGYFDLMADVEEDRIIQILLTGLWTAPSNVEIKPGTRTLGVRFKLAAAECLFGKRLASVINSVQFLEPGFWNIDATSVADLTTFASALLRLIVSKVASAKAMDRRKHHLFSLLYQTKGALSVAEYSKRVGWSSRQINRYFNDSFGLSLKAFCRILRCHASFRELKKRALYPGSGYYDQSHFIKEVKQQTGVTPQELYRNENDRFLQLAAIKEK